MKPNPYGHLDDDANRIGYLIAGYIRNTLTEQEHRELDTWVNASDQNMKLFEDITDENNIKANLQWMDELQTQKEFEKLKSEGLFIPRKNRRARIAWMAAACFLVLLALAIIFKNPFRSPARDNSLAADTTIHPGGNKAVLKMGDGTIIDLSSQSIGNLPNKEGTLIKKADEALLEYSDSNASPQVANHTLTTPAGGQYQVRLPDGTRAWLNAATTLRFPNRFTGNSRSVELDGEAYFEVTKNTAQPFIVQLRDSAQVKVVGTHFNVMSYTNEGPPQITLLEGSVTVSKYGQQIKLDPGSQVIAGETFIKNDHSDIEEVMGWKNGEFIFKDAPIETVMRQVERWYDAKIVFQGKITQQFNASIRRNEPLSKLLRLLELNGYVHFKTENKTIYVLP